MKCSRISVLRPTGEDRGLAIYFIAISLSLPMGLSRASSQLLPLPRHLNRIRAKDGIPPTWAVEAALGNGRNGA
jgi:hypothetical protein